MARKPTTDPLVEMLGLQDAPAAWAEDRILAKAFAVTGSDIFAISALAQPLQIISSAGRSVLVFDYAYFLFVRALCRSLLTGGNTRGALIGLYQYEVGIRIDQLGGAEAAAGLLRSACELRSAYAVYQESLIYEAFLYELSVNVCITHEQAHRLFEASASELAIWQDQGVYFLEHLEANLDRMFSDQKVLDDIRSSITVFRSDKSLMEEVACDLCAIDLAIRSAIGHRLDKAAVYTDGYYAAARLSILSLYLVRIIGRSAELAVQEIDGGRDEVSKAKAIVLGNLSFMSQLRLRFQILLLKVISLKVELKLVPDTPKFESLAAIIETNEDAFNKLFAHVLREIEGVRGGVLINPHLWIGQARQLFAPDSPTPHNDHLTALYLREFWFSII